MAVGDTGGFESKNAVTTQLKMGTEQILKAKEQEEKA